jgi:hypothetical protein
MCLNLMVDDKLLFVFVQKSLFLAPKTRFMKLNFKYGSETK